MFVLGTICRRYMAELRTHVREATRCAISLQLVGECLKLLLGYLGKLCLNLCVHNQLLAAVVEALELDFADHVDSCGSDARDTIGAIGCVDAVGVLFDKSGAIDVLTGNVLRDDFVAAQCCSTRCWALPLQLAAVDSRPAL